MKEILVAGARTVSVERSVDQVTLSWLASRVSKKVRNRVLGAVIVGLVVLAPMLFMSVVGLAEDWSVALPMLLGSAAVLVGLFAALYWTGTAIRCTARLTSAGVQVGGGEASPLSGDTRVRLLVESRGEVGLVEDEVVQGLADAEAYQGQAVCAVHLVVDGEQVPIATDLLPIQALAIAGVLREHLRPGPQGELDAEALDELDRMRRAAVAKVSGS